MKIFPISILGIPFRAFFLTAGEPIPAEVVHDFIHRKIK